MSSLTQGVSSSPGIVKIAETIVGMGGQQTFPFTAVPSGYARLELVIVGRSDGATSGANMVLQFNGDTTAANYKTSFGAFEDYTTGQIAYASPLQTAFAGVNVGWLGGTDQTEPLERSATFVSIPDYTDTTHYKAAVTRASSLAANDYENVLLTGWWLDTSAITDITLHMVTNKLIEGSTVRLYGVV